MVGTRSGKVGGDSDTGGDSAMGGGSRKGGDDSSKQDNSKKEDNSMEEDDTIVVANPRKKHILAKSGQFLKKAGKKNISKKASAQQEGDTSSVPQAQNAARDSSMTPTVSFPDWKPAVSNFSIPRSLPSLPQCGPTFGTHSSPMGTYLPQPPGVTPNYTRPSFTHATSSRLVPTLSEFPSSGLCGKKTGSSARRPADRRPSTLRPLNDTFNTATTAAQIAHDREVAEKLQRTEEAHLEEEDRLIAENMAREQGEPMDVDDQSGAANAIRDDERVANEVHHNELMGWHGTETRPGHGDGFRPSSHVAGPTQSTQGPSRRVMQVDSMPAGFGASSYPGPSWVSQENDSQDMPASSRQGLQTPPNAHEMPPAQPLFTQPPGLPQGPSAPASLPSSYALVPAHIAVSLDPTLQTPISNLPPARDFYSPLGRHPAPPPIDRTPTQEMLDNMIPGQRRDDVAQLVHSRDVLLQSIRIMTSYNGRVMRPPGGENAIEEAVRALEEFLGNLRGR